MIEGQITKHCRKLYFMNHSWKTKLPFYMKNVHLDMKKTPQCYLKTLEIQQYKGHVKTFTALKLLLLLFNVYPKID